MGLDKEDIKALISILQKGLADDDFNQESIDTEPEFKQEKKTKSKKGSKTIDTNGSKPKFVNKFTSMPEASMHKEDSILDKKLNKLPPTKRARQYKPVSAKCRVCGKSEKVNPSLLDSSDRYKCNRCSTSPG